MLVVPNAFKGTWTADRAASQIARGVRSARPGARIRIMPMADGGDGTLAVLSRFPGVRRRRFSVAGPLGERVSVPWLWQSRRRWAGIEMARASGLVQVPLRSRDPLRTTSFGTGQLIRAALRAGAREVWVGLGGSATVDGGAGILQALGLKLYRKGGRVLGTPARGKDLLGIFAVDSRDLSRTLGKAKLVLLTDVGHRLSGPRGAAAVFGPQKGASPSHVRVLERGLAHWANLIRRATGRNPNGVRGGGAAGGAAAGLWAFANAEIRPGAETLLDATGFDSALRWSDRVITGEGRVDDSTFRGKAVGGVLSRARRRGVPVWVVAGSADGRSAARVRRAGGRLVLLGADGRTGVGLRRAVARAFEGEDK